MSKPLVHNYLVVVTVKISLGGAYFFCQKQYGRASDQKQERQRVLCKRGVLVLDSAFLTTGCYRLAKEPASQRTRPACINSRKVKVGF